MHAAIHLALPGKKREQSQPTIKEMMAMMMSLSESDIEVGSETTAFEWRETGLSLDLKNAIAGGVAWSPR